MEERITEMNGNLEGKINNMDKKLDNRLLEMNTKIDENMEKVDSRMKKMDINLKNRENKEEERAVRMENRMNVLEKEIKKSDELRSKTEKMKEMLKEHPQGRNETEDQPKKKKAFSRQIISQEELVIEEDHENRVEEVSYRSNWANEVENLSKSAAGMEVGRLAQERINLENSEMEKEVERRRRNAKQREKTTEKEEEDRENLERWEVLQPKPLRKVRRPVEISCWFGDEGDTSSDTSTSEGEWKDIDRKGQKEDRKRRVKMRRKLKEEETFAKARAMLGLGTVLRRDVERINKAGMEGERIRKEVVHNILKGHLDFNEEELTKLDVRETHMGKEDFIYFAAGNPEMLREIHVRKAESQNDELKIRNFIPPQLFQRFRAIDRVCAERRKEVEGMKTQLRFGSKEVEVYTKVRDSGEGFKKVDLREFMGENELPPFDHSIRWRRRIDKPERRIPDYGRNRQPDPEHPSKEKKGEVTPPITRQRSETLDKEAKRHRGEEMEEEGEDVDMSGKDSSDSSDSTDTTSEGRFQENKVV